MIYTLDAMLCYPMLHYIISSVILCNILCGTVLRHQSRPNSNYTTNGHLDIYIPTDKY